MKWYLIITTTVGVLDLSIFDQYYATKEEAERMATVGRSVPGVVSIEVKADVKKSIMDFVKENPGCRKRDIASALGMWVCNLAKPMYEMKEDGLLKSVYHNDPANLEFYDEWYAA